MPDPQVTARRIKTLREESDWSREELAKLVRVSYSAIAKYETGERTPDLPILQRLPPPAPPPRQPRKIFARCDLRDTFPRRLPDAIVVDT
ncbi:MAG: helix-turn-helix transcriptional regulator [Firmicutes bacterium]|nr:helix-turn-helix transcriptional regulator [Candidatus Fermentithermobacillaceae bacterium]